MKTWKIATLTLVIGTLVGSVASGVIVGHARADYQPRMKSSLELLRQAKDTLVSADEDKGGFRAKAIELTQGAIDATERGIEWANHH